MSGRTRFNGKSGGTSIVSIPGHSNLSRPLQLWKFAGAVFLFVLAASPSRRLRRGLPSRPKFKPDFCQPEDVFIHGMIVEGGKGGTCASMPVLYVAVGRRIGLPLYLVGNARGLVLSLG